MTTGYLHRTYAESFAEFGEPIQLPHSGGWILERPIAGSDACDAMGLYPLFLCRDWSALRADLEHVASNLVSLVVVTDPFGHHDVDLLNRCFTDGVIPFKEHFVADLDADGDAVGSRGHRRDARRALSRLSVESLGDPPAHLDEWTRLYDVLVARHGIRGIGAFSRGAFEHQLRVPGLVAFRARRGTETVGMALWYLHEDAAYWHLGAFSDAGYTLGASYALMSCAIQAFRDARIRWLNLGAGAGVSATDRDGLSAFKRNWATGTRTAYLCGRIFDRTRYRDLAAAGGKTASSYFPAYREGEFRPPASTGIRGHGP